MQLQMTAPLDIGLEQQDAALNLGQDDIFDLARAENALRKQGTSVASIDDEDDENEVDGDESDNDEVLDSDEEREGKTTELEAELDRLYNAYQDRLRDRDAKYRMKEARRKNAEREEWHGIQTDLDDDDYPDAWHEKNGSAWSAEDSESDSDAESPRKRPRIGDVISHRLKRPRLVTKLEGPKIPMSKAAQLWFSQGVFDGLNAADAPSEDHVERIDRCQVNSDDMAIDEEQSLGSDPEDEVNTIFP